jgi:hexulose-6-phosphate isomerase
MSDEYLSSYADSGFYMMQGRLTPPEDSRFQSFPILSWKNEINNIPKVPLRGIEWIYDLYSLDVNPLNLIEDRIHLKGFLKDLNVDLKSICADYFMDCPIVSADSQTLKNLLNKMKWLISISPELNISRIVVPFVDKSKIKNEEEKKIAIQFFEQLNDVLISKKVELHLETDFGPKEFASFLKDLDNPLIKVNYDAGNSSGLGYKPAEEFQAYGEHVGSFHIKDRQINGGTVPLGQGDTDFDTLRKVLIDFGYKGDFVLQVARGVTGDELSWMKTQTNLAYRWLKGEKIKFV